MLVRCVRPAKIAAELAQARDTGKANMARARVMKDLCDQLGQVATQVLIDKVVMNGHLDAAYRYATAPDGCDDPPAPLPPPGAPVPNPPPAPRQRPTTAALPVLFVLAVAFLVALGETVMAGKNTAAAMARAVVRPGETMAEAAAAQRGSQFARAAGLWRQAAQEAVSAGRKPVVELGELAYCAFRAGDEASALEACDQLRDLDPVSPDHHYLRGLVHEKAGRRVDATASYRMALLGGHARAAKRLTAVGVN